MSTPTVIEVHSSSQLKSLVEAHKSVLVRFYKSNEDERLGTLFSTLGEDLATKKVSAKLGQVECSSHPGLMEEYNVTSTPAVLYVSKGKVVQRASTPQEMSLLVVQFVKELDSDKAGGSSSSSNWRGAGLPRGYSDITDQIELQRCELLNVDSDGGGVRTLFESSQPSALSSGQGPAKDYVESDTDEQLMLFMPFQSMLKLHTIQITSIPPQDDDDDEAPMRPRTIKLFSNKPHNLGFDEAESMAATQVIELTESDWNSQGTANVALRYVKFQNINSLVMFVVDGDGESEKVRLDRIRLIGEAGEKREMGKLEKIGDEPGE